MAYNGALKRFIPALAGNIYVQTDGETVSSVHPGACGEHKIFHAGITSHSGSSPRLRGTWGIHRIPRSCHRFIPALAGNITHYRPPVSAGTVHPRACGEHRCFGVRLFRGCGSSPRLRGTCRRCRMPVHHHRFIPALAGNIRRGCYTTGVRPVHPRACGEH